MPKQRVDIDTGKIVIAYTFEEAVNLAARMMATSDSEQGMFALGIMTGMAIVDQEKYGKSPYDKTIDDKDAFSSIAQGAVSIQDDFIKTKRSCVENEVSKGPMFLELKHRNIDIMIEAGRAINKSIDDYLKSAVDKKISEVEKMMADNLKGDIDAEKKAGAKDN